MSFNLFDTEERVIEQAQRLATEHDFPNPEIREGFLTLIDAFRKGTREQKRLVKFSDRLQDQVASVNLELQRRREEAELALQRLQETQESLIQSEKLASLGVLVAGVAHEINTPVGIALSSASHLAEAEARIRGLFDEGRVRKSDFQDFLATASEATDLILSNCQRAAALIQGFKQVAVDQTSSERRPFGLATYLNEILVSLTPKLRQLHHKVEIDCPENLIVDSYPGALSQIVTNFLLNSMLHGYDEGQTGVLRMRAREAAPGQIELRYSDDGKGIPEAYRARVFDPFFTTKRGSGGSGLGLHIVYNLITGALRGTLAVESEEGRGTTFIVTFPQVAPMEALDGDAT